MRPRASTSPCDSASQARGLNCLHYGLQGMPVGSVLAAGGVIPHVATSGGGPADGGGEEGAAIYLKLPYSPG